MELQGKIILELPLEEGISKAGKPWKKKGWVLETFGQFPRQVKFDVFGDRVNTLFFEVNKSYSIQVDAQSREFNGKWYTDLSAYQCAPLEAPVVGGPVPTQQQYTAPQPQGPVFGQPQGAAPVSQPIPEADPSEDLPF